MSVAQQIQAIDALRKSKGWQIVHRTMQDEIVAAAMQIADTPHMTQQEVDFRRGAIFAAKQLLELPQKLQNRLEAERMLSQDDNTQAP